MESKELLNLIYYSYHNTTAIYSQWSLGEHLIYVKFTDGTPNWDIFKDFNGTYDLSAVIDLHNINLLTGAVPLAVAEARSKIRSS